MSLNLNYDLPSTVRNFSHDFRIAIFSFERDFTEIASFNYDTADLIIRPQGITNVSYSISTSSSVTGGQFTLIGGLGGEVDQSNISISDVLKSKVYGAVDQYNVENLALNLSSVYSNVKNLINKMDYIAIFTKDPRTNRWYGSTQTSNTSIPKDAKPKFLGLISDVGGNYNVSQNRMEYTIKFKSMLRLVELTRYTVTASLFDEISTPTGINVNHGEVIKNSLFMGSGKDTSSSYVIKEGLKLEYPSQLLGSRVENDKSRAYALSKNTELQASGSFFSSWETKLNFFRQAAQNKDFEFYADEDGQIVWKIPTYARGINLQQGNFVNNELFNPSNPDLDLLYHISDFTNISYNDSEAELVNFVSGVNDFSMVGLDPQQSSENPFAAQLNAFYIKGGKDTPSDKLRDRNAGILDIGLRPVQFRNPLYYNAPPENATDEEKQSYDTSIQQVKYYDFKVHKNNISRGITATLNMMDNPYIQVGMPIIIPQFANAGFGDLKGKIIPSIYYISALSRKYEYQKPPMLTLTLTHGRFAQDEFHNGVHIYEKISAWMQSLEPTLVYDVPGYKLFESNKRTEDLQNLVKQNIANGKASAQKAQQKETNEAQRATEEKT